jgi:hypothetical protein
MVVSARPVILPEMVYDCAIPVNGRKTKAKRRTEMAENVFDVVIVCLCAGETPKFRGQLLTGELFNISLRVSKLTFVGVVNYCAVATSLP